MLSYLAQLNDSVPAYHTLQGLELNWAEIRSEGYWRKEEHAKNKTKLFHGKGKSSDIQVISVCYSFTFKKKS